MTKRHLRTIVLCILCVYAALVGVGIVLALTNDEAFQKAVEFVPLVIAPAGAYLVAAYQRRISYLQALRALLSHLVDAVSASLVYCDLDSPGRDEYTATLR